MSDRMYFETPDSYAELMASLAWIDPNQLCLEPSAGRGAIARAMAKRTGYPNLVECCEINPAFQKDLRAQLFDVVESDFLQWRPSYQYPAIVMNPPFMGRTYVDHILHAWELLAPAGRLVTIVPDSLFWGSELKTQRLREILLAAGITQHQLSRDTFKDDGVEILTHIIAVSKPL